MAKLVRKFGGDYYELQGIWPRKLEASGLVEILRKRGKSVRVVRTKAGYSVYKRRY